MPTKRSRMTVEEFEELFAELSNWGRWGDDDTLGTMNFVTPARVVEAVGTVTLGRTVTLSLPVNVVAQPDNPHPAIHYMASGHDDDIGSGGLRFATDFLGTELHGDSNSHIDALCHVSYDGELYNGRSASLVTASGAQVLDIDDYRHGIVGRGVLLDLPRLWDVPWLELGTAVTAADLDAAEQAQGVEVREGDILVFRTGEHRRRLELGPWDMAQEGRAGLHPTALRFLADRGVAAFAPDGDGEAVPSCVEGIHDPIHPLQIVAMGMAAMDSLQFEDLAPVCEELQRWEFLFVASPLRIGSATGSPLNPIAVF